LLFHWFRVVHFLETLSNHQTIQFLPAIFDYFTRLDRNQTKTSVNLIDKLMFSKFGAK
jgi:uncharacterized membrane protein